MRDEERLTDIESAPMSRRAASRQQKVARPQAVKAAPAVHEALDDSELADNRDEREDDLGEMSEADEERYAAFLDSIDAKVLPDLPKMPGYHVCWLSTQSQNDTIAKRMQMGYELITPEMVPGFQALDIYLKSAQYPGVVSLNEMVAARIPERLFQRYMKVLHHDRPLGEEEKVQKLKEQLSEGAAEVGSRLQEGSGMSEFVQRAPVPVSGF